jgi:hypothetical protein
MGLRSPVMAAKRSMSSVVTVRVLRALSPAENGMSGLLRRCVVDVDNVATLLSRTAERSVQIMMTQAGANRLAGCETRQ